VQEVHAKIDKKKTTAAVQGALLLTSAAVTPSVRDSTLLKSAKLMTPARLY
jgi:hypothetical protein